MHLIRRHDFHMSDEALASIIGGIIASTVISIILTGNALAAADDPGRMSIPDGIVGLAAILGVLGLTVLLLSATAGLVRRPSGVGQQMLGVAGAAAAVVVAVGPPVAAGWGDLAVILSAVCTLVLCAAQVYLLAAGLLHRPARYPEV